MARVIPSLITLLLVLESVCAAPFHARHASIKKRQDLLDEYDFVVVGAGTAGLTVGDRLSESGEHTVLVVEYGYHDHSPSITQVGPASQPEPDEYGSATRFYNMTSTPREFVNGETGPVICGAVVGGSSAVNGMLFDRGTAEDYDAMVWVTATEDGDNEAYASEWGWENILPWFKKSVTFHPPSERMVEEYGITYDEEAAYGGTTPIHSSFAPYIWKTARLIFDAYKTVPGVDAPIEGADGHASGVFWIPNSIDPATRTRSYSMLGHYENADGPHSRENFHLLPAHRATQVVLGETDPTEDDSAAWEAQSVLITPRDGEMDEPLQVGVAKEVVVSAGTFHTPQVLQRSGIGPKAVLEAAGVEVKVDLPGVGLNLQDHSNWGMNFNFTKDAFPNPGTLRSNETFREESLAQWEADKTGPYAANVNSGAFLPLKVFSNKTQELLSAILEQDPAAHLPKGTDSTFVEGYKEQIKAIVRQYNSTESALLEIPFSGNTGISLVHLKPLSRGTVMLDPEDDGAGRGDVEPVVDYRTFSNPIDLELTVEMFKFARYFYGGEAMMESLGPVEVNPGEDTVPFTDNEETTVDEAAKAWIKSVITSTTGHPVGTASIGPVELGFVLGPDLRVHGVQKLSVADNSIMSILPGTHTSSSAYAIGEKAADLVLRRFSSD